MFLKVRTTSDHFQPLPFRFTKEDLVYTTALCQIVEIRSPFHGGTSLWMHREIQLVFRGYLLTFASLFISSREGKPWVCGVFVRVFEQGSDLISLVWLQIEDLSGKGLEMETRSVELCSLQASFSQVTMSLGLVWGWVKVK